MQDFYEARIPNSRDVDILSALQARCGVAAIQQCGANALVLRFEKWVTVPTLTLFVIKAATTPSEICIRVRDVPRAYLTLETLCAALGGSLYRGIRNVTPVDGKPSVKHHFTLAKAFKHPEVAVDAALFDEAWRETGVATGYSGVKTTAAAWDILIAEGLAPEYACVHVADPSLIHFVAMGCELATLNTETGDLVINLVDAEMLHEAVAAGAAAEVAMTQTPLPWCDTAPTMQMG